MLKLGLLVAAMFLLQAVLSCIQMRHFAKEFTALRRRGKVACGRKAGGFHAGAIVLFLISDDGRNIFNMTPSPWQNSPSLFFGRH